MNDKSNERLPNLKRSVRAFGGIICVFSLIVMAGWIFHSPAVVQMSPAFEPMKFNTALAFLFCGTSLLLPCGRNTGFMGLLAMLIGLLTLLQYIFHFNSGFDTFFVEPFIRKRAAFPGRMSPNAATGFILAGFSLFGLSFNWGRLQKYRSFAIALASSLVVALGVAPLLGYLTGTQDAYVWGLMVGMAFHTAVVFILLGLCLQLIIYNEMEGSSVWLSGPVFVMIFAVTLSLWQAAKNNDTKHLQELTNAHAQDTANITQKYLADLNRALGRMANRWDAAGGTPQKLWETDALAYLQAYPVLRALVWADPQSHVQWMVTLRKDIKKNPGFNIAFEEKRRRVIEEAKKTRHQEMSDIIAFIGSGRGYLSINPLYVRNRYDGFIVAAFDINDLFDDLLSINKSPNYFFIRVYDGKNLIFSNLPFGTYASSDYFSHTEIMVANKIWRLEITPNALFIESNSSKFPGLILGIGMLIAFLSSLSVWLAIRSADNARQARHNHDQVANFIKHVPTAIAVCDRNMRYIMVSDRWYEDFRIKDQNIVGKSHYEVFYNSPDHWKAILTECLENGKSSKSEDRIELKSGRVMWMRWDVRPWHDSTGAVSGLIMATEIITERKEAEVALREARAEADRANAAKSDFLANMSHEIRTPMNGVIGMTQLLMNTDLDGRQRHYAETVANSAESLMQIINDILDFSKIEAGKMELESITFDFRTLCEEVADMMAVRTQEKNVEFFLRYRPDCPAWFTGDPGRLRQILFNLCGNSIKFTEKGHVLLDIEAVDVDENSANVRIVVQDTGIGIPKERQGAIFNKFDQADSSTTRRYGGTGLGLAISQQLVEAMGGKIELESRVGQGTEMSFTLRLQRPANHIPPPPGAAANLQGLTALIVDDNKISCEILRDALSAVGMKVEIQNKPAKAVSLLEEKAKSGLSYDFLILDYVMPGMTGLDVARAVKDNPLLAGMQMVLATSQPTRSDLEDLKQANIRGYLTKPLRTSELLGVLVLLRETRRQGADFGMITRYSLGHDKSGTRDKKKIRFRNATILVAEDNPVNQEVLTAMLDDHGIEAVIAPNGQMAVDAIGRQSFDLVFMDCQMPEMDGFEATRVIRETSSITIIALTANAMKGDREKCLAAGMNDYLGKPVLEAELEKTLLRWLPENKKVSGDKGAMHTMTVLQPASSVLDPEVIKKLRVVMKNKFSKVMQTFLETATRQMSDLKTALKQNDRDSLVRTAHSMKASSGQLGAMELQKIMASIEEKGTEAPFNQISRLVSKADNIFIGVRKELIRIIEAEVL